MTTLLTPAYRLTMGASVVDTTVEPKASATTDLLVTLDMDDWPDTISLTLGQVGGLVPKLDDKATIEMGYADNGGFVQVFVGLINELDAGLTLRRLTGTSEARALTLLFVDKTYEGQTAGQIARDLASRAGLTVGTVDDGIAFPVYVVDSRRNALAHLRDLATLSGVDAYFDSDGKLVFQAFTNGNIIHDVDFAKQVLTLAVDRRSGLDVTVKAFGESPTGSAGSDAWGWLTKDFSRSAGTAGTGTPTVILERPELRTAQAASTAASAELRAFQRRAVRGRVDMLGRPEVKLGDAIRVREVPTNGFNDIYQVRRVVHRITKEAGFTTSVGFSAIPSEALQ
ncbi:Phage protein D [Rhizobiales bacterium GAS191]|nr:Phage protein D [Rhizobiales bacterium GAS191]